METRWGPALQCKELCTSSLLSWSQCRSDNLLRPTHRLANLSGFFFRPSPSRLSPGRNTVFVPVEGIVRRLGSFPHWGIKESKDLYAVQVVQVRCGHQKTRQRDVQMQAYSKTSKLGYRSKILNPLFSDCLRLGVRCWWIPDPNHKIHANFGDSQHLSKLFAEGRRFKTASRFKTSD